LKILFVLDSNIVASLLRNTEVRASIVWAGRADDEARDAGENFSETRYISANSRRRRSYSQCSSLKSLDIIEALHLPTDPKVIVIIKRFIRMDIITQFDKDNE
jgi:hypothetical protein